MDRLEEAMINLKNSEDASKEECMIKPASKLIGNILKILQKKDYIGEYEYIDDGKAGIYRVELKGNINDCKAIKPRYPVKKDEYTNWKKRYLPAERFGNLIVTTPKGVMTAEEAEERETGGRTIAYIY